MKKLRLLVEFEYDDELMHADDVDSIRWFKEEVLGAEPGSTGELLLHSQEIGDTIGTIKVLEIELLVEALRIEVYSR